MNSLLKDLRFGFRMLLKTPGLTVIAIITLALGIGANTAVFSLTYALLLRPLPVPDANRLVLITYDKPGGQLGLSGPMLEELKKRQQVFSGMLAWRPMELTQVENGEGRAITGALVSGDGLGTLGIRPALGRVLVSDDDRPGGGPDGWAALISYRYWRQHFNADAGVLGKVLSIEGMTVRVVGVTPADFEGVEAGTKPDIVLPLQFEVAMHGEHAMLKVPGALWLTVIGRLKPGMSLGQAKADIERIGSQVLDATLTPPLRNLGMFKERSLQASPGAAGRSYLRVRYKTPVLVLQALVGLILLITCANLAGLLSARAASRRREFAIRRALGASQPRLLQQFLLETVLLVVAGTGLALLVADYGRHALIAALIKRSLAEPTLDRSVFAITAAASALAALLGSVLPALHTLHLHTADELKESRQQTQTFDRARVGRSLIAAQAAVSVILLVAAGLFASTLYRLLAINPGFRTQGLLVAPTDFRRRPETGAELIGLYERILERLNTTPGITLATAERFPLIAGWISSTFTKSVLPDGTVRESQDTSFNAVGAHYFAAMGTQMLAGRNFQPGDRSAHPVCILNASAAKYFFPGRMAVGSYLTSSVSRKAVQYEVVGVVEDTKYRSLREPSPPMIYTPFMQAEEDDRGLYLLVRANDTAQAALAVRRALQELAPGTPLLPAITMREQVNESIGQERVLAMLSGFFAALGLLLTAIGLYGLLAFQVTRRTTEIGIRMALGAQRTAVIGMVVREAMLLVGAGVVVGLGAAVGASRLISSLLYGTKATNPTIYAAGLVVMITIAMVAAWRPARRAASTDPMEALRAE